MSRTSLRQWADDHGESENIGRSPWELDGDDIGECPYCGEIGLLTEHGCEWCDDGEEADY
jgi:hypothetical protein